MQKVKKNKKNNLFVPIHCQKKQMAGAFTPAPGTVYSFVLFLFILKKTECSKLKMPFTNEPGKIVC